MRWWSRRKSLLDPERPAPSAEEVAARPDLLKAMLAEVSEQVYPMDLEMGVLVCLTTTGEHRVFHTYGRDLPTEDVARLFQVH